MKQANVLFIIVLYLSILFTIPPITYASSLKINEILVHPSTGNKEWVEMYNPDKIDLSDYWVDDDSDFNSDNGNSSKKSLKDLLAGDTSYPYIEISSMFNNSGDSVVLFDANGTILDQYIYSKDPGVDISLGRSPDGTGDFITLQAATKGTPNSKSMPTNTPTPTLTPKPSEMPTHTSTPTPPTTIKTPTLYPTLKTITPLAVTPNAKSPTPSEVVSISVTLYADASSTAVLGASTSSSATPTVFHTAEKKAKTKIAGMKTQKSFIPVVALAIAGISFIGCGILVFRKMRKNTNSSE